MDSPSTSLQGAAVPASLSGKEHDNPAEIKGKRRSRRRKVSPFWAKQLHLWHWMSSAICLVGMVLFAITGITLNHAADIKSSPVTKSQTADLPFSLIEKMEGAEAGDTGSLPVGALQWADEQWGLDLSGRDVEWNEGEAYVPLSRPGGDGWVAFDLAAGTAEYELTDRGWIAWLNDLHKGRDSGAVWSWFIDIFAGACIIFSLTGLVLLWLHSRHRKSTWPLVAAGLVIPLLIIILFVHN
ncbi:MAG: PepSY-associated TM helix domain-containing protein [Sphingomonadaceae bacterium]